MTDRKTIEDVINRCYAARQQGDIETLIAAFDKDGAFGLAGSKKMVAAVGTARGHQAIRENMTGLIAAFDLSIATSSASSSTTSAPPSIRG